MRKHRLFFGSRNVPAFGAITAVVVAILLYGRYLAPTRIAVVNFQDFHYADMVGSKPSGVRLHRYSLENRWIEKLGKHKVAFIFGKGLRLTPDQQMQIARAGIRGTAIYVFGGLTPDIDELTTFRGEALERVRTYLGFGGPVNMSRLLQYSRQTIDSSRLFTKGVEPALRIPANGYFYTGDQDYFETFDDYQAFYSRTNRYNPQGPRVLILTSNLGPQSPNTRKPVQDLMLALEKKGMRVYPTMGFFERLERINEVRPDLIIFIAHGRLAPGRPQESDSLLRELNVPLLCPVVEFRPYDKWIEDKRGLAGGMLGQNIVMPEIDGGIVPFAIGAEFYNSQGLKVFKGIPGKIETFSQLVKKLIDLKRKNNAQKRIAIVYYKGPGRNALTATGLDVTPSLLNLLQRLRAEGYNTGDLPQSEKDLFERIQNEGRIMGSYAQGASQEFLSTADPQRISTDTLNAWMNELLPKQLRESVEHEYGRAPGNYLSQTDSTGKSYIAIPRIRFGNIVLLPQLHPGKAESKVGQMKGFESPPPYPYIAEYLWIREGFGADALIHFGTYGSFEFLPHRQPPLTELDWPEALLGSLPHVYVYCVESVGDALVAKRRGYAVVVSHLTPPFKPAGLYGPLRELSEKIDLYKHAPSESLKEQYRATISDLSDSISLAQDLGIDRSAEEPFGDEQISALRRHIEAVADESIHEGYYTLGKPYSAEQVTSTCKVVGTEMLANSLAQLDLVNRTAQKTDHGGSVGSSDAHKAHAAALVNKLLNKEIDLNRFADSLQRQGTSFDTDTTRQDEYSMAASQTIHYMKDILRLRDALESSAENEFLSILNALSGGFIAPSSGGDPLINPQAVPTGRNLYGINAEHTPDKEAVEIGKIIAEQLIARQVATTGNYPRKVAVTLWGGEFVRDRGATIAQILHLIGARPVMNKMGIVHGVELIPCKDLKRPRIDVVVQTSGQFRDIAASRLSLIHKAIVMAASANDTCLNYVELGTLEMEQSLKDKGYSPAEARALSTARVFGGVDGHYGAGIREMVQSGSQWNGTSEIAANYIANMGALYTGDAWGELKDGVFASALRNTDVVSQSVNSHITGPLALDNVWEFMGGISAAITAVTGREPQGVFCDMRDKFAPRVRDAREMLRTEARSSLLNPYYIRPVLDGGSSGYESFAEMFRNCFGWNSLTGKYIDSTLWEQLDRTFIDDVHQLDITARFEEKNPFALQEMTAVMLESIRKGFWNPGPAKLKQLAQHHAQLIDRHKAGCSMHVCNNPPLRKIIGENLSETDAHKYNRQIDDVRGGVQDNSRDAIVLKKEANPLTDFIQENSRSLLMLIAVIMIVVIAIVGGSVRKEKVASGKDSDR